MWSRDAGQWLLKSQSAAQISHHTGREGHLDWLSDAEEGLYEPGLQMRRSKKPPHALKSSMRAYSYDSRD